MKQSTCGLRHFYVFETCDISELLVTAILGFTQAAAENGKQF
jgi:hypothetical protein